MSTLKWRINNDLSSSQMFLNNMCTGCTNVYMHMGISISYLLSIFYSCMWLSKVINEIKFVKMVANTRYNQWI